jgi:membrane associated rhomboid family serine protease
LLTSLVPHYGVSWQAHLCGAIAGVVAAWVLSRERSQASPSKPSGQVPASPLDRALSK